MSKQTQCQHVLIWRFSFPCKYSYYILKTKAFPPPSLLNQELSQMHYMKYLINRLINYKCYCMYRCLLSQMCIRWWWYKAECKWTEKLSRLEEMEKTLSIWHICESESVLYIHDSRPHPNQKSDSATSHSATDLTSSCTHIHTQSCIKKQVWQFSSVSRQATIMGGWTMSCISILIHTDPTTQP